MSKISFKAATTQFIIEMNTLRDPVLRDMALARYQRVLESIQANGMIGNMEYRRFLSAAARVAM